jgi:drug/metabolite transporter (DMT)-like permease
LKKIDRYTAEGLLAILVWSTTVAFSRTLSEALGPLTTGAAIYTLGGGLACLAALPGGRLGRMLRMPRRYLLGCGAMFLSYTVLLYAAVGLAASRAQVLAVGLANYLWPTLILLFSLPILHKRGRWIFLLPGVALALGGTWLAVAGGGEAGLAELLGPGGNILPVALAAAAAVLWGFYSNYTKLWGGQTGSAVPLFLLASGLACLPLRFLAGEASSLAAPQLPALLYMALFPAWLGYSLWDHAMQKGDKTLVTAFSYFTPLLSTLASLLVLQVPLTPQLGLGAVLVFIGAVLSKLGVTE